MVELAAFLAVGTIIVDLVHHSVVDVLDDRSVESAKSMVARASDDQGR